MSRHRFYQNAEEEYSDDGEYSQYGSSYGTSYGEDGLSTSVEKQYLYNRGQSGTTPKMSSFLTTQVSATSLPDQAEFEMDLEIGAGPPGQTGFELDLDTGQSPPYKKLSRRDSGFDTSGLSAEDVMKLNSGLDYILDIVGETLPESTIKEALVKNRFDAELTLGLLLDSKPQAQAQSQPMAQPQFQAQPSASKKQANVVPAVVKSSSKPPSTLSLETKLVTTPTIEVRGAVGFKTPSVADKIIDNKRSRSNSPMPKIESLVVQDKLERAESPSGRPSEPSTPLKQVTMRKEKIDPTQRFMRDRGGQKEVLNLVVVGHVDSGKSTLMGHLLFKLGSVSQKIMHKYEKESKKVGKQSFMFAWVLDETDEERSRGITMDVGSNIFETDHRVINLLDAPGHKDFIPNMISGAYQADVAVLVVNGTTGEFEAGFEAGGQTREHALLVRSLGVSQLVVAVNKLDTVEWSESRYLDIKQKMLTFLSKQAGFREKDITFIPCSGLTGENLCGAPSSEQLTNWYKGSTLIQAIDALKTPERAVEKPFRMSISDVFKGQSGVSLTGRLEAGLVVREDRVLCSPLNEICYVKGVLVEQLDGQTGYAGDHITLTVSGPEQSSFYAGMILCDPANPVPVTNTFKARIVVFNIDIPITKGYSVVLHYGCVSEQATVSKLYSLLSKSTGEEVKRKPRCLTGNCSALVQITVSKAIPVETYKENRELGRFMLRTGGSTIAAGMITEIS